MALYYSKSTNGFYDDGIHGARQITVPDPNWVRPVLTISDPHWVAANHPDGTPVPTIEMPDLSMRQPTVTIANPDCLLPADAVEIDAETHQALLTAQSNGHVIQPDANGNPVAVTFVPTAEQAAAILRIEASAALIKSDVTVARCVSAGVSVPAEWQTYRNALRAIVNGTDTTSTALPAIPAYPSNT